MAQKLTHVHRRIDRIFLFDIYMYAHSMHTVCTQYAHISHPPGQSITKHNELNRKQRKIKKNTFQILKR